MESTWIKLGIQRRSNFTFFHASFGLENNIGWLFKRMDLLIKQILIWSYQQMRQATISIKVSWKTAKKK